MSLDTSRYMYYVARMETKPCKLWSGQRSGPYGIDRGMLAHRRAWENAYGPIPDGMSIHHSCESELCVEETHLIAVTCAEHRKIHVALASSRETPLTKDEVNAALRTTGNNKRQAALILGVSRPTLYRYLAKK